MGLGQLRGPSSETGIPRACNRSIPIFALSGWEVCDGAHWLDVMKKKIKGPALRFAIGRATRLHSFRQSGTTLWNDIYCIRLTNDSGLSYRSSQNIPSKAVGSGSLAERCCMTDSNLRSFAFDRLPAVAFGVILPLVYLLLFTPLARATKCDCRPEFNTEAEASGTCSKAKDDTKWCKLKFNGGNTGVGAERHRDFIVELKKRGLPEYDTTQADRALTEEPPEKWGLDTVRIYFPALFAAALWDTPASDRLKRVVEILKENSDRVLQGITREGTEFTIGNYKVDAAKGCVQLIDSGESFSVMVRTRFADSARQNCGK